MYMARDPATAKPSMLSGYAVDAALPAEDVEGACAPEIGDGIEDGDDV